MSSIRIIDSSRRFGRRKRRRYTRLAVIVCLLLAGGLLLWSSPLEKEIQEKTVRQAADDARTRQGVVFAGWYEEHQEHLLQLDRVWQSYILIQRQFAEEEIGVESAYERMAELAEQAAEAEQVIRREKPPLELEGEAYDLTAVIYHRTADYAKQLKLMVQETSRAAEGYCRSEEEVEAGVMSRRLREISARLSPTALFTEKEVARLRELFRVER